MPLIENTAATLAVWAALGYLLGAVPFGLIVSHLLGHQDPRQVGSGNIGATNVLRSGSKAAAALTLVLDGAKGVVAVLAARAAAGEDAAQVAGLAAFLGHCFPVWLGFRGGKGVATFLGLMLSLAWPVGLACCATWAAAVAISRISSMGALAAAASSTIWMIVLDRGEVIFLGMALTLLLYARHWQNISRLRAGREPRIGQKR